MLDLVYRRLRDNFYEPAVPVENSELLILLRRFSHRELGTMIGASRKMVSKVLSDSIFGGYVELRDSVLVIVRCFRKIGDCSISTTALLYECIPRVSGGYLLWRKHANPGTINVVRYFIRSGS